MYDTIHKPFIKKAQVNVDYRPWLRYKTSSFGRNLKSFIPIFEDNSGTTNENLRKLPTRSFCMDVIIY